MTTGAKTTTAPTRADEQVGTGLRKLDDALGGGLAAGSLTAVVSHSGAGANTLALQIACWAAAKGRRHTTFFALDSRVEDVLRRALSCQTRVRATDLGHVGLRPHQEAASRVFEERLHVIQMADRDPREVLFAAHIEPCGGDTELIVIDPLNMVGVVDDELSFPSSPELSSPAIADFLRHLKARAVDHRSRVIVVVNLPAISPHPRENGPDFSTAHLAEAGAAAQIADNVILLYRPDQFGLSHPRAGEADLLLAKGPVTSPYLYSVAQQLLFNRFSDFA